MKRKCHAKLNLVLDVIGKTADGFHRLAMINAPLELHDVLDISIAQADSFVCDIPELSGDNSVLRAIDVLRDIYGFKEKFNIVLEKNIPLKAGLGGGSSDAAMAIVILDELLALRINNEDKIRAAEAVGKDVPFCLFNKTALVTGTGEQLTFIENKVALHILLVQPRQDIATGKAYELVDQQPIHHYDTSKMQQALRDGSYPEVCQAVGNSFEEPISAAIPEIVTIKQELRARGFEAVGLCGSGSCVFGLGNNAELTQKTAAELSGKYPFVQATGMKV